MIRTVSAWRRARAAGPLPLAAAGAPPPALRRIVRIGIALDVLVLAPVVGLLAAQAVAVVTADGSAAARSAHLVVLAAVALALVLLRGGLQTRDRPADRLPSRHLLGLVPAGAVPPLLWVLARQGVLPPLPAAVLGAVGLAAPLLLLARAVAALRAAEWIMEHDLPTRVPNLAGVARAVRERARHRDGDPLALCLVALDDFKGVNDSIGGAGGNALLALVAERLGAALGPRATVGRLGGDRFLVVLPDHADAGRDVLAVFAEPFPVAGRPVRLTASVGVTALGRTGGFDEPLGRADLAAQAAKAAGRATVVRYRAELHEQLHAAHRMARELRDLLEGAPAAQVGRLVVVYQPVVDLSSHRIVGCEALLRWQHPERGLVMPDAFLPAAEQGGLTTRLDALVLDLALAQLAAWDAEGLGPVVMSVNLGLASVTDPALLGRVQGVLEARGLTPDRVRLEITEHSEVPGDDAVTASLRALADLGVPISLDDFGTGYTSMAYLCRYPIRLLKLDRSIVSAEADRERSPLLEGIIGLSSALDVDVVAEGVETEAQRHRLAQLGVGYGQGYLFGRPLDADALAARLRERPPEAVARAAGHGPQEDARSA